MSNNIENVNILQELTSFKSDMFKVFNKDLYEIVIHGSFCLDEFRRHYGDLDFIVFLDKPFNYKLEKRIYEIFECYRSDKGNI